MARNWPWSKKDVHRDDPYWDFFIKTPPAALTNTVTELIRNAPAGNIFPTKADIHTPEVTSQHVKDMAQYFGAEWTGIAKLERHDTHHPEGIPSPYSAPCGPSTGRAYRRVLAARYRCKMVSLLPSC